MNRENELNIKMTNPPEADKNCGVASPRLYYERSMLSVWESGTQEKILLPEIAFFIKIDRIP